MTHLFEPNHAMTKPYLQAAREALTRNAKTTSVANLETQGLKSVRVIRAGDILRLIEKAVDRAIAEHPHGSKKELVGESQATLQELSDQEKALHDSLAHAADLERQLHEATSQQDVECKRCEELKKERDALRAEIEHLEEQQSSGKGRESRELKELCGSLESQLSEATAGIARFSEVQDELAVCQVELDEERGLRREREIQLATLRETMVAPAAVESIMEELRTLKDSVVQSAPACPPGDKKDEGAASASLEKLTRDLADRLDRISRKVGVSMGDEPAPDLEKIFQAQLGEPLESNIGTLKVKERKGGSVAGALARMKALKQGSSQNESGDDGSGKDKTPE